MVSMDPEARAEKRLAYATGICTLVSSSFGFLFATRAPSNIRWMIWPLGASMFFFGMAFLLVGWWAQRSAVTGTAWAAQRENRLLAYLVAAVITVPSATLQSSAVPAPFGKLLLWNFAILVILIALVEFTEWRKRRPASV